MPEDHRRWDRPNEEDGDVPGYGWATAQTGASSMIDYRPSLVPLSPCALLATWD
jgi:hypothetical protein